MVELYECVPYERVKGDPWAGGPWCWLLRNPKPLVKPVPWRGVLRLFEVPDEAILMASLGEPTGSR